MQERIYELALDVKEKTIISYIEIVSGDKESNIFEITLKKDGVVFPITDEVITIAFNKSDKTTVVQSSEDLEFPITVTDNVISCTVKTGAISVKGMVLAEVVVASLDGKILTSQRFQFYVRQSLISDEVVEATDEFPMFAIILIDEIERKASEIVRKENEIIRISNETHRFILQEELEELEIELDGLKTTLEETNNDIVIAEGLRVIAEVNRVDSEGLRVIAEGSRVDNEDIRVDNEVIRVDNEDNRVIVESDRVVVEGNRVITELARVDAEDDRVIAEGGRVDAEDLRVIAETSRDDAEGLRVTAESDRETAFYTAIDDFVAETELVESEYPVRLTAVEDDLVAHKADYTVQTATIKKNLNDFQSTMANVNVNQEAKQEASGRGIISLPKTSANGNAEVGIKGLTLNNIVDGQDIANGGTVSWNSVLNNIYYDSLNNTEVTGTGSSMSATNNSGATADMMIINKTALGITALTTAQMLKLAQNGYFEGIKSTVGASRLKSVGKNLFDENNNTLLYDGFYEPINGIVIPFTGYFRLSSYVKIKPSASYSISLNSLFKVNFIFFYDTNFNYINSTASVLFTTPSNAKYIRFHGRYNAGASVISEADKIIILNTIQLELGSTATPYEPYTESAQYIPNVGELRSLPNGVADEIVGGELVKRVSDDTTTQYESLPYSDLSGVDTHQYAFLTTDIPINTPIVVDGKTFNYNISDNFVYTWRKYFNNKLLIRVPTGITPVQTITFQYQLATPITTPIEVSGTLLSNPSGTVYVENVVADADVYTTKFDISDTTLPIKSIDKVIKYDFTTGVQTVLDESLAVINANQLSFTHTGLTSGDMVFVDYYYDVNSTLAKTTISCYDSRYVIKDTTNSKYYKWVIKSTNGVPTVTLTEVV